MPNKLDKSMMNSPYYAGYSKGNASKPQYPYPSSGVRAYAPPVRNPYKQPQQGVATTQKTTPRTPQIQAKPLTPREQRKLRRAKRRNKNYFFVMRRGISFFMFLCFFLYIAAVAVSFVNIPMVSDYVSLFTMPDNTAYEERWEVEKEIGEDGFYVVYQDKSEFVSVGDPIRGFFMWLGILAVEPPQAAVAEEEGDVEEPLEEEGIGIPYYLQYLQLMEDRQSDFDITPKIAYLLFKFFPAALALGILIALIAMITSFGAARGRRIYKGFAVAALIMFITGVVTMAAGYALSNVLYGNPMGPFDLGILQSFLLRGVMGPPLSEAEALAYPQLQLVSGYLLWAMIILPLLILILSIFCRKKVSYRIFDK